MSEKMEFRSGEILTASNLNKAFNEKLNTQSVDEDSSISIENGIAMNTSKDIDIKSTTGNATIEAYNGITLSTDRDLNLQTDRDLNLTISENPNYHINVYQGDHSFNLALNEKQFMVNTTSTKVLFNKRIFAPYIRVHQDIIQYNNNRTVNLPDLEENATETLTTTMDTKQLFFRVEVSSSDNKTLTSIYDMQKGESISWDNFLNFMNDRISVNSCLSDRVYIKVSNTSKYLKFIGRMNDNFPFVFSNGEYKARIGSIGGYIVRTGFNGASVEKVFTSGNNELPIKSSDANAISCYLNDNNEIVKVLSFYMYRDSTDQYNRITKIYIPLASDGFPLYEGNQPVLQKVYGLCGVKGKVDATDPYIESMLRLESSSITNNASNIILTVDWSTRPKNPNYNQEPCIIYAEWI